jgi:AcrR family transcriptional regulator
MPPIAPSTEQKEETRRRIVAVAADRFSASTFSAVTMDEVARELGMSKKTLYECFPTKLELLRATVLARNEACERELTAIKDERLEFFARARKTFGHVSTIISRLSPAYLTDLRRNAPEVWAEIQAFRRERVRRHMHDLLEQGVAQGVLRRDLDLGALTRLYLTMISALLDPELSGWTAAEPISPLFDVFVRVYFEGLVTEAGRKGAGRKP